jgi:hypothetical protein
MSAPDDVRSRAEGAQHHPGPGDERGLTSRREGAAHVPGMRGHQPDIGDIDVEGPCHGSVRLGCGFELARGISRQDLVEVVAEAGVGQLRHRDRLGGIRQRGDSQRRLRRAARAPATSRCGGNELIRPTSSAILASLTSTPWRRGSITKAACCAAPKSTYRPVRPPTKDNCSICANHCPRTAAEPNSRSECGSRTALARFGGHLILAEGRRNGVPAWGVRRGTRMSFGVRRCRWRCPATSRGRRSLVVLGERDDAAELGGERTGRAGLSGEPVVGERVGV